MFKFSNPPGVPKGFRNCGEAGKTTWVECFSGRGTAGVAFSSAEEAANAITMLNGTGASGTRWNGMGLAWDLVETCRNI